MGWKNHCKHSKNFEINRPRLNVFKEKLKLGCLNKSLIFHIIASEISSCNLIFISSSNFTEYLIQFPQKFRPLFSRINHHLFLFRTLSALKILFSLIDQKSYYHTTMLRPQPFSIKVELEIVFIFGNSWWPSYHFRHHHHFFLFEKIKEIKCFER